MHRYRIMAIAFLMLVPVATQAQETPSPAYTQEQLEQMLAPVALYPDPLLAQILMASTYPLEVAEAQRWQQENSSLSGNALAAALQQQPWDPSVKALASFPQVLQMMDGNLQWTEQLGDAFLANQPAVMDTVQHLRQQAQAAGTLKSTPQQTVSTQGQDIVINPVDPQTMYVPYYNPSAVYGAWPYPDYQPYYFPPPPGYVTYDEGLFGFGIGVPLIVSFWDWDHWDWRNHRIDIDDGRFRRINHNHPPVTSGVWQHNPVNRHGVPYHSASVQAQFQRGSQESRRSWRGYTATLPVTGRAAPQANIEERVTRPHAEMPAIRRPSAPPAYSAPREAVRAAQPHVNAAPRPSIPAFESFSRGSEIRAQATRGAQSRAAAAPHEAPHAAPHPSGGGGHGNDRKH